MDDMKIDVIAIDGPAGSGKSTTARLVAKRLGFTYLDTGAMYRALTLKILKRKIDVHDESEILALIPGTEIELQARKERLVVILNGKDVTRQIRSSKVSNTVSIVSTYESVREWMVSTQRKIGEQGRVVAEGRDIGTVVFPNARLKIFLTASLTERAMRRQKDFSNEGKSTQLRQVAAELNKRDLIDSTRAISPLKKADDAIELDTSNLTVEQQVEFVVEQWMEKLSGEQ
jgi:cytidylate kinase